MGDCTSDKNVKYALMELIGCEFIFMENRDSAFASNC